MNNFHFADTSITQPPMLCDRCKQPIFDLRLLKYQVYDTMQSRYIERKEWLCAKCWHNWQEWLDVTEPQTPDNADETLTADSLDETASKP